MRGELFAVIEELARAEGWTRERYADTMGRAANGPLTDLLPNIEHFQANVIERRADIDARALLATRSWRYEGRPVKATKQAANPPTTKGDPDRPEITDPRYADPVKRAAMLASSPLVRGAVTGRKYSEGIFGTDADLPEYVAELRAQAKAVKDGDMTGLGRCLRRRRIRST
ncbi:hypothetical protein [Paraburkholderia sp. BL10I2N1]|uniref:hypothetical protein n=1 Tax=Paraburkholderia sp. BL10I2N1 TaxID=1938796 RepID=UPI003261AF8A